MDDGDLEHGAQRAGPRRSAERRADLEDHREGSGHALCARSYSSPCSLFVRDASESIESPGGWCHHLRALALTLQQGDTVGAYRLLFRLGAGGMGEVWAATSPEHRAPVALKVMRGSAHGKATERFIDEARMGFSIRHPNIVQTLDLGREGELIYIAMELVRGPSMSLVLQACVRDSARLSPRLVAFIGRQVALALHHAYVEARHEGGPVRLIHRDITPHNLLLDASGRVLLTDFGVARSDIQQHETKTGVIVGKPAYMSPEPAGERSMDHRSDLFSLGIVLYEAATVRRLFGRHTVMASLRAVTEVVPIPIVDLVPGFPPALARVIARLLEKRPADRWSSATMLVGALQAVERDLDGGPATAAELGAWVEARFPSVSFDPAPTTADGATAELTWPAIDASGTFEPPPLPRAQSSSSGAMIPRLAEPETKSALVPWLSFVAVLLIAIWLGATGRLSSSDPTPKPTRSTTGSAAPPVPTVKPAPVTEAVVEPKGNWVGISADGVKTVPPATALLRLIARDDAEGIKRLIAAGGATPNYVLDKGHNTPLHEALRRNHEQAARALLEAGANPNEQVGPDGSRALHIAARLGKDTMIALLVRHGATVDLRDGRGDTPLMVAASIDGHGDSSATDALLGWHADPNVLGRDGQTALIRAVTSGDIGCLEALLVRRVSLETATTDGGTALWHAAYLGRADMVALLLAAGASKNARSLGKTPLDIARSRNRADVVALLDPPK